MNLQTQMLPLDSIKHAQINVILEHYGEEHQIIKACEELAELQVEIFHISSEDVLHSNSDYDAVVSEIADVYIMLEQLVKIYNIKKHDVDNAMVQKLRRTEDRILSKKGVIDKNDE